MKQVKKRPPVPAKSGKKKRRGPQTAQQTIPYVEMLRDGVCKVREGFYTKSIEYEDINYAVASSDDQATIFDGYCAFLNYFDSALLFQLSFINHRSRPENRYSFNIPTQNDEFDSIRGEYVDMLAGQIAKSNNGIVRSKYITFGIQADGIGTARPRLERVEADIMGNFKKLGVQSRPLTGRERLEVLHSQLHPGGKEKFAFSWSDIPKTGMGTKDFIAPTSFDFRQGRAFRVGGTTWGAVSYMQIMASELSDKLLAELLEVDAEMTVTLHIQTVDQGKAIKTVKAKLTDIDRMKVDEQKKAVRSGYDIDILPPDLVTFSKDAAALLADLQSRNERMFLLTFLILNTAPTRPQLENDIFTLAGIVQKYNCALKRLDFQQEQGYMSNVTLTNNTLGAVIAANLDAEQQERYAVYQRTQGNRPYLFADNIYAHPTGEYTDYEIPPEALADPQFAALIAEAEKYLGYPYVWGGSKPSTSFDCSGFVCWVLNNSGVYPMSRTTAQGIFNQTTPIAPSEAKPGDIIFFTGTYDSSGPVSHVGIYVGDNMMIHCASGGVQYARMDTKYWTQHFYAFGRLTYN